MIKRKNLEEQNMFFSKKASGKVKTIDEVLSNDNFDQLSVDLVDMDFALVGGDHFEVHYHGPEDKKPIVTNVGKVLELKEPKVERKNGKFWEKAGIQINIVGRDDVGMLKVTIPINQKLTNTTIKITSGDAVIKQVGLETLIFTSVSGDLSLQKVKADEVAMTETSGDIKLEKVLVDHGKINLVSGDCTIQDSQILTELKVMTTSGDNLAKNIEVDQCDLQTVSGDNLIFGRRASHAQIGKELNGSSLTLSTLSGDNTVK